MGGGGAPVARTPERRPAAIAPAGGGRTGASVFSAERARALQDAIQRSKLTAADPWGYTSKARKWETRARELAERLARDGESASLRQALDALSAEVERDRDFQEARRLF
ncbi:MAG TPA: hypothetical protein VGW35_05240 [Methylomirabilota bacterium]|jgi:hypothetical protein|nr:hypothetical protein [Methylomirabilota bacterium]